QKVEVKMREDNTVQEALISGGVRFRSSAGTPVEAEAGKATLSFDAHNTLTRVHADEQVKLHQHARPGAPGSQEVDVAAPAMNFFIAGGRRLSRAETVGPPQIVLPPANPQQGPTLITAGKFTARFDASGELSQIQGENNARITAGGTAQAGNAQERVAISDRLDAFFRPGTGLESVVQQGHFVYRSGPQQAFAARARYTPGDQMLVLDGSPRIIEAGMETTAQTVRLNRATGEGFAAGNVKTTYSDLKTQTDGALLASADPIHVTAQNMSARSSPLTATYTGRVRLWQNANVVEAPSLQFQKEQRTVVADAAPDRKVSTVLVGTDKDGKATPVTITSGHLVYRDSERRARFEGGVRVRGSDLTITAKQMDILLAPSASRGGMPASPRPQENGTPARLEKIVASGSVVITEPNRRGTGDRLTYTSADDKFVLSGGPPSIFDAEHGK